MHKNNPEEGADSAEVQTCAPSPAVGFTLELQELPTAHSTARLAGGPTGR